MDPDQIRRIRTSWERVQPHGPQLAEAFYRRMFELDPRLEDLFAITEMTSQGAKFVAMMTELVRLVDDPDSLRRALADSGRRHGDYGVRSRDYLTVGEAFLWALDHALPGGLDADTKDAWAEAYTRMAFWMQRGARASSRAGASAP